MLQQANVRHACAAWAARMGCMLMRGGGLDGHRGSCTTRSTQPASSCT